MSNEPSNSSVSWTDTFSLAQTAIQSLSAIIPSLRKHTSSPDALSLLNDPELAAQVSALLRQTDSGAGDNQLCRWLYDTFHTAKTELQLVVLRFLPIIAGVYLSRVPLRKPLSGFEAVLLAIYAHETTQRNGQAITVNLPDLSHSSIYHETKHPYKTNATELNLVVISPSLEPQGTIRSTRRARIIGVALELYYTKILDMPTQSKMDFCEFCIVWAGQDPKLYKQKEEDEGKGKEGEEGEMGKEKKEGRVLLPWEMLQPMLRILGHCLIGIKKKKNKHLQKAAKHACRSLYARAVHDINPKAILATRSLLTLAKLRKDAKYCVDHTELPVTHTINL